MRLKKYSVFVNGTNFKRFESNSLVRHGYYTTRYVKAINSKSAIKKAFDLLKKENNKYFVKDKADPASMFVEKVLELESFGDELVPGEGFALYIEKRRSKRTIQMLKKYIKKIK